MEDQAKNARSVKRDAERTHQLSFLKRDKELLQVRFPAAGFMLVCVLVLSRFEVDAFGRQRSAHCCCTCHGSLVSPRCWQTFSQAACCLHCHPIS